MSLPGGVIAPVLGAASNAASNSMGTVAAAMAAPQSSNPTSTMTRALIEVAPAAAYVGASVAQDDTILRAEASNAALWLGTGSNLALSVAASNVAVTGALAVNGVGWCTDLDRYYEMGAALTGRRLATLVNAATVAAPLVPGGYINHFPGVDATVTVQDASSNNTKTVSTCNAAANMPSFYSTVGYVFTGISSLSNTVSAMTSFGLSGANTYLGSNMIIPPGQQLTNLTIAMSNPSVTWARPVVFALGSTGGLSLRLAYAGASNNNNPSLPAAYVVPSDGSNYFAAFQIVGSETLYYPNAGTGQSNLQISGTWSGQAVGSSYAFTANATAFAYSMTYASGSNPNTLTTVSTAAPVTTLTYPTSNVYVAALAYKAGTQGVYNSNYLIDVTADAGSNWSTATLCNVGAFDSTYDMVCARAAVTPGSNPKWRVRMYNSNLMVGGMAMRFV